MASNPYAEEWDFLARKTRRHPLLYETPTLRRTPDRIEIRQGPMRWWGLVFIGFAVFFVGFIAEISEGSAYRFLPLSIFSAFSALAAACGFNVASQRGRITLEAESSTLHIRFGRMASSRNIILPITGLRVRLHSNADQTLKGWKGHGLLSLESTESDSCVNLVAAKVPGSLEPAFRELSLFLGNDPTTQEMGSLALADGSIFQFSKLPMSAEGGSFRTMQLSMPKPDTMEWTPTAGYWLFNSCVVVAGIIAFSLTKQAANSGSRFVIILTATVGTVFTGLGLLMIFFGAGPRRVIVNKQQGTMKIRWGFGGPGRGWRSYPLNEVVALQICSRFVEGNENSGYMNYELNAILSGPGGRRINMVSHGDQLALQSEADRLAIFIDKPLFDHTS